MWMKETNTQCLNYFFKKDDDCQIVPSQAKSLSKEIRMKLYLEKFAYFMKKFSLTFQMRNREEVHISIRIYHDCNFLIQILKICR